MNLMTRALSRMLDPVLKTWFAQTSLTSKAGATVTPDSALSVAAFMAAARAVCVDTACMPTHLYRRLPEGGKERATDVGMYQLLHAQPNQRMDIFQFKIAQRMAQLMYGNSFALIQYDAWGSPVALWPLDPETVTFDVDGDTGELRYYYVLDGEVEGEFTQAEILHRRGLTRDGVTGLSVIQYAAESLGIAMVQQDDVSSFFKNGSRFGGFIRHPSTLSDRARENIQVSLANNTRGPDQAWKWKVIEEGMEIHEVGVAPKDAQLLESRQWSAIEACQWTDVPPWRIHMLENGLSYASLEQQFANYATFSLRQWYYGDDLAWTTQLLTESQRKEMFFETDPKSLLMGDTQARFEAYDKSLASGWMCVDEVRERENMNPLPDGSGKTFYKRLEAMGDTSAPPA